MKKTLLSFALLLSTTLLWAVPAKHVKRTLTLRNGDVVEATLQGDEHLSFYTTADGKAIRRMADGTFDFADIQELRKEHTALVRQNNSARKVKSRAQRKRTFIGNKKGLVILVNFPDKQFSGTNNPQADYSDIFNKQGYSDNGMTGSVRDYFYDQSYGKLNIDFDVIGPVTVSQPMEYYGGSTEDRHDKAVATMISEAVKLIDDQVNYADYDWDGDGDVDQVYVIYAGYGEAQGGGENTIWPHEWQLSSSTYEKPLKLDGVTIDTYACSNELRGSEGKTLDGIGTACHEFSHCLGLPDFYDTDDSDGKNDNPMAYWDILDYGAYNNNSCTPAGYTSYERWYAGWLEPIELTGETVVTDMAAIEDEGEAYVLYNDENRNEYYLLENRQQTKWDLPQKGHGLLVIHVDYDEFDWTYNMVNTDADHRRMSVIPADNSMTNGTTDGDPFPYNRVNALKNDGIPAATVFNANTNGGFFMNKPIEEITEKNGKISFVAMKGYIDVPVLDPITEFTGNSFTVTWDAIEGATKYLLTLSEEKGQSDNPADAILLSEDFSTSCYSTSSMVSNIGGKLDKYLSTPGWTGNYLYPSKYGIKMYSGNNLGSITTPLVPVPDTRNYTFWIYARPETGSSGTAQLSLSNGLGATLTFPTPQYYLIHAEDIKEELKVTLSATSKIYISSFTLYDGIFLRSALTANVPRKATSKSYESTENKYTFTGLTANSTYTVHVAAVTEAGTSNYSKGESICLSKQTPVEHITLDLKLTDNKIYDLSGRRVEKMNKGIYIVNGKKVIR